MGLRLLSRRWDDPPHTLETVDGAIGEGSRFHEQYGYYAQGVAPDTATLPRGWQRRLVRIANANTDGFIGLCLEATHGAAGHLNRLSGGRLPGIQILAAGAVTVIASP